MSNSKAKPVKRQHFVQRAYLTHFASQNPADGGRIWVYDKKGGPPRLQSPVNSGIEKDIYTVKSPKAPSPDMLERDLFTQIENVGYPVLKELAANEKKQALTAEDIGRLSGYLAAAHLRVPRNIDSARQLMEATLIESLKETARDPKKLKGAWEAAQKKIVGRALTEAEVKDMLENPEKHVKIKADRLMALLLNLQQLDEIGRLLLTMHWAICDAPSGTDFITGDSPLIVFAPMGSGKVIFGGGFGLPQVQIHFPISPRRCLYISHAPVAPHRKISKEAVLEVNRRCAAMAERFVYSSRSSENLRRVVMKFEAMSAGVKVDRAAVARKLAQRKKGTN